MATLPSSGDTDWGTKLNAYLAVGHNADGTHGEAGLTKQVVNTQSGSHLTDTTHIPDDDTIPQITEGTEAMTRTITPTSATNKLKIDVVLHMSGAGGLMFCAALFRDAVADALACGIEDQGSAGRISCIKFTHYMTAPGTDEYTFRVRFGSDAGDSYFNGKVTGRMYGGVLASSITITEIQI